MAEIGREQFCARFHYDALRDIAYCPSRHKVALPFEGGWPFLTTTIAAVAPLQVATCGDTCIKVVDMKDWKVCTRSDVEVGLG